MCTEGDPPIWKGGRSTFRLSRSGASALGGGLRGLRVLAVSPAITGHPPRWVKVQRAVCARWRPAGMQYGNFHVMVQLVTLVACLSGPNGRSAARREVWAIEDRRTPAPGGIPVRRGQHSRGTGLAYSVMGNQSCGDAAMLLGAHWGAVHSGSARIGRLRVAAHGGHATRKQERYGALVVVPFAASMCRCWMRVGASERALGRGLVAAFQGGEGCLGAGQ